MQGYFYGWYLKCQSDSQTVAVIPAVHGTGRKRTCSIQLITEDGTWIAEFSEKGKGIVSDRSDEKELDRSWKKQKENVQKSEESIFQFRKNTLNKKIRIGNNCFHKKGFQLNIHRPELSVTGNMVFDSLTPLRYDIMGPFALVPFMECRHMVYSMYHRVNGRLCINGKDYVFKNAYGYWEGDRGRSFPKEYAWTQCLFPKGSIMMSVADIPLADFHFTGMIGVVLWKGREYRFATYLGARVRQKSHGRLLVTQGKMELEARLLKKSGQPLYAPSNGRMQRTIHESVACRVFYRFAIGGRTVFAFETDQASFEYEYEWRK